MAGRDAGDRSLDDNENQRTLNKIIEQPEKAEGFVQETVTNRQALRELSSNTDSQPSPRGYWRKRETAPAGRSLGLPASFENSFSLSDLDVLEDSSSNDAPTENAKEDAHDGTGPALTPLATCEGDDAGIICAGGPKCGTAAAPIQSLADFQGAEGEPSGVLNPTIRTFDMSYTETRDKEMSELYWHDVYNHLRNREQQLLPDPWYMHRQPHIASYMRSDLVDWIVALADEYGLHDEKLFLAVSYIDRFLSLMSVQRNCLQLLGTAALFTASKFEGGYQLRCSELLYATGDIYTKEDLLWMEQEMLKVLDYNICAPTIYYFLRRFGEVSKAPAGVRLLAQYFCELALLDDDPYLRFPPSLIAGAALSLANHTLDRQPWGRELAECSGYQVAHFQECLPCLHTSLSNAPNRSQKAIRNKFNTGRYLYVASLKPSTSLPCS
ncbi:hypothetical protein HPB48_014243 [Haemaphysalis longicornis]|uniref:Cyclin N-terminal domain-containing protein n=1 Tax=Haemaphysalis longicornis TaxID=44386 RepID=A0A9J6FJH0_HAELO|nr:hypothetical protein HPB48_014243 [Haemaphysalis longicornis]